MTDLVVTTLIDSVDAEDGVLSLREAVTAASAEADAGTITFDASILTGGKGTIETFAKLEITAALAIRGDVDGDGTADITLDARGGSFMVVDVRGAAVELDGLEVRGGGQGGIWSDATSHLTFSNGIVTQNVGNAQGAGIRASGDLDLIGSVVSDNRTESDGGGVYAAGGTVTIRDTAISGNSAGSLGGGLYLSNATVIDSTISGNSADYIAGGAMAVDSTFRNVAIIGNDAKDRSGGAELVRSTIENATIVGNSGSFAAGAYLIQGSTGTNLTITGNVDANSWASTLRLLDSTLTDSIVTGNINGVDIRSVGSNSTVSGTFHGTITGELGGGANTGGVSAPAVFATVAGGAGIAADNGGPVVTVALKEGANPAVDAAGSGGPATDARGYAANGQRDAGAYERGGIPPAPQVGAAIAPDAVDEDTEVDFAIPAGAFVSGQGDLALTAFLDGDAELPGWLFFDAQAGTFAGTPPADFTGELSLAVVATDENGAAALQAFTLAIAAVNDAPVAIVGALAALQAVEESAFDLALPAGMFTDVDDASLTYSATLEGGAALPGGLSIDAGTGALSGTPPKDLAGLVSIAVTATDAGGLSATRTIGLDVEDVPDAPVPNPDPVTVDVVEDEDVAFALPEGLFSNPDPAPLAYAAALASGDPLPSWLVFDPDAGTFAGRPPENYNGDLSVSITATRAEGLSAQKAFMLSVAAVQDPFVAASAPAEPVDLLRGRPFEVPLPEGLFPNPDRNALSYAATLTDGAPLPGWMAVDPATGRLSGTPGPDDAIPSGVLVRATDEGGRSAVGKVPFSVTDAPAPEVTEVILAPAAAREDEPFSLGLPSGLFAPGIGETTVTADGGSGTSLPEWMRFDAATMTLSGTPPADFAGEVAIRLLATDAAGNAVERTFAQVFENVPDAPVVTVRAASIVVGDGAGSRIDLAAYASDADGDALVLVPTGSDVPMHSRASVLPSGATLSLEGNGSLAYAPSAAMERLAGAANGVAAEAFTEVVELLVRDGIGGEVVDTMTLTFTVTGDASNDDWVFGDAEGDALFGRAGDDRLLGFDGDDTLIGNGGADRLNGGSGNDVLRGHRGPDSLFGADGDDLLLGGRGDDRLGGGTGDDVLRAAQGDDELWGRAGEDLLRGGAGADALAGGRGADRLIGGAGDDVLTGGLGADAFVFAGAFGIGTVTDWGRGRDVIDLRAAETTVGALDIRQEGDDAVIEVAAGTTAGTIILQDTDAAELDAGDFLL